MTHYRAPADDAGDRDRVGERPHRGWVETVAEGTPVFLGIALAVLGLAFMLWVLATVMARPARAAATERQIRSDCRADAVRVCPVEAARCLISEDADCRAAIIGCMIFNRNKLRVMCARHLMESP